MSTEAVTPKPKPMPKVRLLGASVVKAEEIGSIQLDEATKPKPKPRDREKVYVTNTAFRDSEALRELQRNLHREANKRGKA